MGVERTVLGGESQLLELLRSGVKNTFLHFDCSDEDVIPKAGGLMRHRTDPTHAGPARPERAGNLPDVEGQTQRGAWVVEGRKLRGKDTRLAKTFTMAIGTDGLAAVTTDFVVMLVPKAVNKRRGGASFGASRGRGGVQVKCNDPPDLELELTVTLGKDLPPVTMRHNFDKASMCTLPSEWDLEQAIEKSTDSLSVVFEVGQRGLRLTRLAAPSTLGPAMTECSAEEEEEAPFPDSDREADWSGQSWPVADFTPPTFHVMTPASADVGPQWCLVQGSIEPGWQVDGHWWEAWGPVAFAPAEEQSVQVWPTWDASEAGVWPVWQEAGPYPVAEGATEAAI